MSKTKRHIVIVTSEFPPQPGGIGNHAYNLAVHLQQQDCDVTVIADQRSDDGKAEHQFDTALSFSVVRIKKYDFRIIMYLKRVWLTFKFAKKASHVIATGKFSLWNVAFFSFFFNRNTLAVIHGTEVNFKSSLLKKSIDTSLKRFDCIVAVSNYTKSLVRHLNKDVIVIPNGIEISKWNYPISKPSLTGEPVLTTVGRVSSRKGQLNVIRHLPRLIEQYPDLHYHCIGIPTEADVFLEAAKQRHVESHITFHGSVDDQTLRQYLAATDIFVMLSTESATGDVEGFGIAILEANAMGVPAIGSKGCGIEDAIKSHHSGMLVDVDDSAQFIDGITEILNNTSKFKSEASTWAKSHDWSTIVKRYIDLLE
ncbi:glycosyltransferase family 4 protein [Psychroserpens algicola]|uniref:Glycosyltransferase family 4 protein n=1 Tax=Psychroserpens algicola TaxID=1719034 RepID=A0ABT0H5A3_9FLAO|nr:glycosyltransferase family 4 protein [Psychroserpens algicola]MCK8479552.1 glycosyltransferase family 4 protein [Psychroserpens algicola]